jgi:hypothetical protein
MLVDFAITFCCSELQRAMIMRDWWFSIDPVTTKVTLRPSEDETQWRHTCPFCLRNMEDVMDVDIKK